MMRINPLFFFLALVPLFWACSDSIEKLSQPNIPNVPDSYELAETDTLHAGMVRILAAGRSTYLGTEDALATSRERPRMKVEFTYDYSIDAHEMTHQEFADLMGGAADEINRFLPIRNMTYYDAVLTANARSKREGLDTVYTYSQRNNNNIGNCINLENLVFHPEVGGMGVCRIA